MTPATPGYGHLLGHEVVRRSGAASTIGGSIPIDSMDTGIWLRPERFDFRVLRVSTQGYLFSTTEDRPAGHLIEHVRVQSKGHRHIINGTEASDAVTYVDDLLRC